tara:strand:+ start:786 stop:1208 length:423 start_codon:yes stop_codon:yes gene_type:complete
MSALETDLNPNTYIGLSLPLKRDNNNNFALTKNSLQQSQHNLKNLLLTHPLERVGQPEFGCRLRDICFEPIDADLPKKIDEEVRRAVGVWLPYINIKAVNTLTEDQDQNIVYVEVKYTTTLNPQTLQQITLDTSYTAERV